MMRILGRPFLIGAVVILSLILLVLLAVASANTEFFDEYFAWLYAANLVIGILFLLVIVGLIAGIVIRLRQGHFGTRLIAKLALFFGLVGVLPGAIASSGGICRHLGGCGLPALRVGGRALPVIADLS